MTGQPLLVLVHGWGFDAGIWQPLCHALPELETAVIDLGFHGAPVVPSVPLRRPVVAVGHSLGVLWLLHKRPWPWTALVSVNGFARFTEAPDYRPAVAGRVLERMIARLDHDPLTVTAGFLKRCGAAALPSGTPDAARLKQGLEWLRDWDARAALHGSGRPILALAGRDDPIVPPAMTERAFRDVPDVLLEWHDGDGHLLPVTDPAWCAARIRAFLGPVLNAGTKV